MKRYLLILVIIPGFLFGQTVQRPARGGGGGSGAAQDSVKNPYYYSGGKILPRQNIHSGFGSATYTWHIVSIGSDYANRYAFNFVDTWWNKQRDTYARAIDSASYSGSFTKTGQGWIQLIGGNGTKSFGVDTTATSGSDKRRFTLNGQYSPGSEFTCTIATTTITVNWDNGNTQYILLTNAGHTFNSSAFQNGIAGSRYLLKIKQPSAGSGTITWPTNVHWASANAPVLSTTVNNIDIIVFYYDGTTYFGGFNLNYAP
jgi:hypothetical protein